MGFLLGSQMARLAHVQELMDEKVIKKTPMKYWFSYVLSIVLACVCAYGLSRIEDGANYSNEPTVILRIILTFVTSLLPSYFLYKRRIDKTYNKRLQIDAAPPRD
jgi:hypothetical protein